MNRVLWLGLMLVLIGCSGYDRQPASTATPQAPVLFVTPSAPPSMLPTATPVPTPTSTTVPTVTPRPTLTVTQIGSFVFTRSFDNQLHDSLPAVQIPDWIETSSARETWYLTRTLEAYMPFAASGGIEKDVFNSHYADFLARADDFLGQYPDGDGSIPVLMMLGHLHSFQVGWYWGRSPKLLGQEYEQAINLLMKRHPARVPYILDDLMSMGLPIDWAKSTDLGMKDFESLLFRYQFSPLYGEPKGQMYAFVREHNSPWKFTPLPTWYDQKGEYQYGVQIQSIADINGDGHDEIVVALEHAYAGGWGLRLQAFNWQDGKWIDRMEWNPHQPPDAYYGSFGLENSDRRGVQQIVVHYYTGPPGGGNPTTLDIYQWDGTVYTNTLPIVTQSCAYHAFAEAERRRRLGDLSGALQPYHLARRQGLSEFGVQNSPCQSDSWYTPLDLELSYETEASLLVQLAGKQNYTMQDVCSYYTSSQPDHTQNIIEIPQHTAIQSETLTETITYSPFHLNLTQCDSPSPRIVGKLNLPSWPYMKESSLGQVRCGQMFNPQAQAFVDQNQTSYLHQTLQWICDVDDANKKFILEVPSPIINTICQWNGDRYVLSSGQILTSSIPISWSQTLYPQLAGVEQGLMNLADCSGDK